MKRTSWSLPLLLTGVMSVHGFGAPASADCEVGSRPGSTVLYPFFEVDLDRPDGLTTLISINNSGTTERLVRMILWSDWALPILAFDIALPPKDVQTLNLRDVLAGRLPATQVSAGSGFNGCLEYPPNYPSQALTPNEVARLRAVFIGDDPAEPEIACLGSRHPPGRARGYVTADAVIQCSGVGVRGAATPMLWTPEDPSYFTTHLIVDNVLWGDLLLVDPGGNSAQGVEAVSLRGDLSSRRNLASFYGRYVNYDGRDTRSPLPSRWMTRFLNGGAFDGGTDLLIFRDPRTTAGAPNCLVPPDWYPLPALNLTVRAESGAVDMAAGSSSSFPLATQRVRVADLRNSASPAGPTQPFGQIELDLRLPGVPPNQATPRAPGGWVIPVLTASQRFSVGLNASPRDNGCETIP
jgi:hypothetical protein